MFRGAQANPYDDIVAKATDENQTAENWEVILNLCDKVHDEGEQGARNVIAALLKRLTHRNANVQLYSLTLAESLTKNCDIVVHREIASRAFTQALEKIITDRTTHDKVRRRTLSLIAQWTSEFEKDSTLGIMEETYKSLEAKGYKFDGPQEPPPPEVDDEARRREEEELQRVLEMSMRDKGRNWSEYSAYGGGGGGSNSNATTPAPSGPSKSSYAPPPASSGYVPASSMPPPAIAPRSPSPKAITPAPVVAPAPSTFTAPESNAPVVTRVRALHAFEPTEAGELAFEKGDIIKVVDRGYQDWWRGQLKGRTGIFPVNYVEPLPEPTADQLVREAEQEAAVFSQAANVDKLLTLLRQFDANQDNLADNEEIQELYRTSMGLRPKIVKLIDKYSQKRADLVSMNESFVKARSIYEGMMEQSMARVTEVPQAQPSYHHQYQQYSQQVPGQPQQPYGYPGYDQQGAYPGYPAQTPGPQHQQPQQPYGPQYGPQQQPGGAPYAPATPAPSGYHGQPPANQPHTTATPVPQPQQQPAQQQGALYNYDPSATYADPNVQAWAQYYAQGGKDLTGAIYFISIPGVKEGPTQGQAPGPGGAPADPYAAGHPQPHHDGSTGYIAPPAYPVQGAPQPTPGSPTSYAGHPQPQIAPGPYAPGPQGGDVYPPVGYQGLPNTMAGMSLSDGQGHPSQPGA